MCKAVFLANGPLNALRQWRPIAKNRAAGSGSHLRFAKNRRPRTDPDLLQAAVAEDDSLEGTGEKEAYTGAPCCFCLLGRPSDRVSGSQTMTVSPGSSGAVQTPARRAAAGASEDASSDSARSSAAGAFAAVGCFCLPEIFHSQLFAKLEPNRWMRALTRGIRPLTGCILGGIA